MSGKSVCLSVSSKWKSNFVRCPKSCPKLLDVQNLKLTPITQSCFVNIFPNSSVNSKAIQVMLSINFLMGVMSMRIIIGRSKGPETFASDHTTMRLVCRESPKLWFSFMRLCLRPFLTVVIVTYSFSSHFSVLFVTGSDRFTFAAGPTTGRVQSIKDRVV